MRQLLVLYAPPKLMILIKIKRSPNKVTTSSIDHQRNLKEHIGQEQAMHNIKIYHKTILDYAKHSYKNDTIDNCWHNHHNMIDGDYTDATKRDLSSLHNAMSPISKIQRTQEFGENNNLQSDDQE